MADGVFPGLPDPGPGVNLGQSAPGGVNFQKTEPALGVSPAQAPAPGPGPTYELASWGRRAAAAIIDGLVVGILAFIVFAAVISSFADVQFSEADDRGMHDFVMFLWAMLLSLVWFTVVLLVYAPTYMWRTNGKTLGKQMLGIRVVRADGVRMTFWFAVFREFVVKGLLGSVASSFTLYLYALLDVLWPLWDSEHRAIHDFIARTRVVRD